MRFTDKVKELFLTQYALTGRLVESSKVAGVTGTTITLHRKLDPDFDAQCEQALQEYRERLEREADRRAVDGVEEPVFWQGMEV